MQSHPGSNESWLNKHPSIVLPFDVSLEAKLSETLCANFLQYFIQDLFLRIAHLIRHGLKSRMMANVIQKGTTRVCMAAQSSYGPL